MMLKVTNPYSLAPVGEIQVREWSFADRWLDGAQRLHRDRANWQPAYRRIEILESGDVDYVPVGDNPTDLDVTPNGDEAVAVARGDQNYCCHVSTRHHNNGSTHDQKRNDKENAVDAEKTSLNVSGLDVSPACIAGVRTSLPNFKALWGRTKL